MLYLTRKVGESVVINDEIEVTVVDIRGKSIKLGFTFPAHATVLRREIYERIQAENRAAAAGSQDFAAILGQPRGDGSAHAGEGEAQGREAGPATTETAGEDK